MTINGWDCGHFQFRMFDDVLQESYAFKETTNAFVVNERGLDDFQNEAFSLSSSYPRKKTTESCW